MLYKLLSVLMNIGIEISIITTIIVIPNISASPLQWYANDKNDL